MGRPNRITIEQVEEFKKLYSEGINLTEIGRRFNCDRTTVKYYLGKVEKVKSSRAKRKLKIKPWSKEKKKIELNYADIVLKQSKINLIRDEKGNIQGLDF